MADTKRRAVTPDRRARKPSADNRRQDLDIAGANCAARELAHCQRRDSGRRR